MKLVYGGILDSPRISLYPHTHEMLQWRQVPLNRPSGDKAYRASCRESV
jgi:hypothetical protein